MSSYLATEAGGAAVQAGGFFLENVWIIPAIMAVSFAIILGFILALGAFAMWLLARGVGIKS